MKIDSRLTPLRQFAARHPVATAIGCAGAQFLLTILILQIGVRFAPPEALGSVRLAAFFSTLLLPLLLVQLFGLWRRVGFQLDRPARVPVFLASLIPCALFLSMGVHAPERGGFAGEALLQLVNAFGEELLFRGVIFVILLPQLPWQAILLSGVLFGSMHFIHGFMEGNWAGALYQAAVTSMSGMMFAAVRYATGSLWLTVLLHMLLNLSIIHSNVESAAGPAALTIVRRLANAVEVLLAIYVMRTTPRGGVRRAGR